MVNNIKPARTTESLRALLFDTIEDLRAGKITTQQAKTVSDLTGRIIESAALEIKVAATYADLDKKGLETSIGAYLLTAPEEGKQ